jgi:hypothetical protein
MMKVRRYYLKKGLYVRSPYIDYPKQRDFVDSKKDLSGLTPLSNKRLLKAVELSHLNMNIQTNLIGAMLSIGSHNPHREKEYKNLCYGEKTYPKSMEIFTGVLLDNNTQSPVSADVSVTNSTAQVFSDKLIIFHQGLLRLLERVIMQRQPPVVKEVI